MKWGDYRIRFFCAWCRPKNPIAVSWPLFNGSHTHTTHHTRTSYMAHDCIACEHPSPPREENMPGLHKHKHTHTPNRLLCYQVYIFQPPNPRRAKWLLKKQSHFAKLFCSHPRGQIYFNGYWESWRGWQIANEILEGSGRNCRMSANWCTKERGKRATYTQNAKCNNHTVQVIYEKIKRGEAKPENITSVCGRWCWPETLTPRIIIWALNILTVNNRHPRI